MANFTPKQMEYIGTSIALAISQQSDQIGTIRAQGKTTHDELVAMISDHNAELHTNADRVTQLVGNANASALKLKDSTDKIAEAERLVGSLTADIKTFAAKHAAVFADQKAKVGQLTAETSGAMVGLDGRLSAALPTPGRA